jgi:putative endonuclease
MKKENLGKLGEEIAMKFLKKKGYKILERNFKKTKFGEIDLIASLKDDFLKRVFNFLKGKRNSETIVFIEVKTKSNYNFGLPEEELTNFKKERIKRAIQDWFWLKKIETNNYRIDLITVDFTFNKEKPEIRHYIGIY